MLHKPQEGNIHFNSPCWALNSYCASQTFPTKENTEVQKLQVNPWASKREPPSTPQMQNCYLHLQSLVGGKCRVYNQFPSTTLRSWESSSKMDSMFRTVHANQTCKDTRQTWGERAPVQTGTHTPILHRLTPLLSQISINTFIVSRINSLHYRTLK